MLVGLRHPVIFLQVVLIVVSKIFVCLDLAHTGHAYSATEKDKAKAAVLMVLGFAPYLVVTSLDIIAFLDSTLCLVFLICCL